MLWNLFNAKQLGILRKTANDILHDKIHLNSMQFKKLFHYQDFIRKLGEGYFTLKNLRKISKEIYAVIEICKVLYPPDEECAEVSSYTHRGMGKSKEAFTSEKYSEYSGSGTTDTDEEYVEDTDESYSNEESGEEEEKQLKTNGKESEECALYSEFTP